MQLPFSTEIVRFSQIENAISFIDVLSISRECVKIVECIPIEQKSEHRWVNTFSSIEMRFRLNFEMCVNMITMIPIRLYSKSEYIHKIRKKHWKHISKKREKIGSDVTYSRKYAHANRRTHIERNNHCSNALGHTNTCGTF